jgi:anion-transporting  ArsA/GET3 family ATPase
LISFPVFDRLHVAGYDMYPGAPDAPGLDIVFDGTTIVLGANGLGKTTLVTMLFRMCVGPAELANFAPGEPLGNRILEVRAARPPERRVFADRVADKAADATASLVMRLGPRSFAWTRSLRDLSLLELQVDDEGQTTDEEAFRDLFVEAAGLRDFADWILLLRFISFYFEDRGALVWDASAQRQILRLLFLPPDLSQQWGTLEADVLSRDTDMRNLRAVVNRAEREMLAAERDLEREPATKEKLDELQAEQPRDIKALDEISETLVILERDQARARLDAAIAADERESAYRELERLQLMSIAAAFPSQDETITYLFAKLAADSRCLVCGQDAPGAVEALRERVKEERCVVCGSALRASRRATNVTRRQLTRAENAFAAAETRLKRTTDVKEKAEEAFAVAVLQVRELRARITHRSAEIDAQIAQLPPEEGELRERRDELSGLRAGLDEKVAELDEARQGFATFVADARRRIAERAQAVQQTFTAFAEDFLFEQCELRYQPHFARIGQSGEAIEYPAFDLDMTGATFESPVPRGGPEQVSESQREFIDLAFRMTLMTVAGEGGVGSLAIDAPESSLDAVFVQRAADVLTRFARRDSNNRLIVTSNLIEGDLIPELLRQNGIRSQDDPHVVDLLNLAAPTAAIAKLRPSYEVVRARLFEQAAGA